MKVRIKETQAMISDVVKEGYLNQFFGDNVKMDTNRLVLGGHSFGGITAIATTL